MSKEDIFEYFKDIDGMYNECNRYDDLKKMLSNLEEVKHGHWIDIEIDWDDYYVACSVCGEEYVEDEWVKQYFHYCPNCGAKMDEVEDEID